MGSAVTASSLQSSSALQNGETPPQHALHRRPLPGQCPDLLGRCFKMRAGCVLEGAASEPAGNR